MKIQSGSIKEEYHMFTTDAPEKHDGSGTFTFSQCKGHRVIFVNDKHTAFQEARYYQFNYYFEPVRDWLVDMDKVAQQLFKRLKNLSEVKED